MDNLDQVKCPKCGEVLELGIWPFCPHGSPQGMLGEYRAHWEDNLGPEPVWVTSLAQKQALLKGDGSRPRLEEVPHRLTPSQAYDRLMSRREKLQSDLRAKGQGPR